MSIQIGIAPDSWGVWFSKHEKQPPWDRCLDEMQAAGYAGVELGPWGYLPNDPAQLKKETTTSLCLDTGHHVYGGGEPIFFYRKHADRIPLLRVKDCDMVVKRKKDVQGWSFARAVAEGIMVEPGSGGIDYTALRNTLESCGYDGWVVVEQYLFPLASFDIPFPIAKRSFQKLKAAGF